MAEAYKCDKCKQMIDGRKFGVVRLFVRNEKSGHLSAKGSYDLCPECYSQIEKMLYGPETD